MATLGFTQVEGSSLGLPIPIGPLHLEVWRVSGAGGGAVGDTASISPKRGRYVVGAVAGAAATTTLSTQGTDTQVVFTLKASIPTNETFDTWLLIAE